MVEEDITVKERTFKQMKDDRLGEQAAKRLHDEEQAQVDRQRTELQRKRQQEILASAMYYTEADWINIMAQVEANTSLSKTLMGNDVSEDNFPARMAALIKRKKQALAEKLAKKMKDRPMTQGQQRTYMRQFVKNQSCAIYSTGWSMVHVKSFTDDQLKEEFEKIQKALSNIQIQAFSKTLKRTGPVTKRKSLGRNRLTKPKSKLTKLDLDADDQTFIKVVSNEDFEDEAPLLWSALVGWGIIPTPLGEINALYRIDRSTAYFTTLREILHMVDIQDLLTLYGFVVKYYDNHPVIRSWRLYTLSNIYVLETVSGEVVYMFADVSYHFSVKLVERMLKHKLEIDKDVVGNDVTTAEQLIQFIKN
nr:JmjC domain-containing protein [Tanacetum cinerariifolium]